MAALGELDLDLDELGRLFVVENDRARLVLERLAEDGCDLDRLDGMLAEWRDEVDVFDALGLHGGEQFHSNVLAWLLDPRGSHGLGDHFLQGFLAASGASRAIRAADRPSTIVRREKSIELDGDYGRLDIWMLNQEANFVCAVENKVWASEGEGQLAWYRKVLARDHHGQRVHRVFLTPRGARPDDPEEREHWTAVSYTDILGLVEGTMAAAGDTANGDVLALLRQYAITLRRNIVPEVSNDVHALARRIYRKHRQAIDLIIEHRERYEPNHVTEWFGMSREAIAGQPLWREATCNRPYARFVSADWEAYEDLLLDGWPYFLLLFELHATPSGVEASPGVSATGPRQTSRNVLIEAPEKTSASGGVRGAGGQVQPVSTAKLVSSRVLGAGAKALERWNGDVHIMRISRSWRQSLKIPICPTDIMTLSGPRRVSMMRRTKSRDHGPFMVPTNQQRYPVARAGQSRSGRSVSARYSCV